MGVCQPRQLVCNAVIGVLHSRFCTSADETYKKASSHRKRSSELAIQRSGYGPVLAAQRGQPFSAVRYCAASGFPSGNGACDQKRKAIATDADGAVESAGNRRFLPGETAESDGEDWGRESEMVPACGIPTMRFDVGQDVCAADGERNVMYLLRLQLTVLLLG